jgi:hypothetical protein
MKCVVCKQSETVEGYLHISDKQVQADYEAAMEQVMERMSLKEGVR